MKPSSRDSERTLLFIPMYNCERQITRVLKQLTPEVRGFLSEVIVVNNRSTDGGQSACARAAAEIRDLPVRILLNRENYGLGGSHKVAFNYALDRGFDYIIVLHGDDQGSIGDLLPLLRDGAHRELDCLLGARFMKGSRLAGYSKARTLGNHVFNLLYSAVARERIYDLGSGLNLYRVRALKERAYLRHADDLTFNYHMILHSLAQGLRLRFFPLEWREDDQLSNVKMVRQSLRVLEIALSFGLRRKRYLTSDYAAVPGRSYLSDVVYDNTQPAAVVAP